MADTLTLTNPIPIIGEGGGGSSSGIMVVHTSKITTEGETLNKLDKTWQEIKEAIDNDIFVVMNICIEDEGYIDVSWAYIAKVTYDPEVDPELDPESHPYTVHTSSGGFYVSDSPDGILVSDGGDM